jgi:hypothetical protein
MIYFIETQDRKIKIGFSDQVGKRIQQLASNVGPVTLLATQPGDRAVEALLHEMFADERLHGEWFEASPRLLRYANGLNYPTTEVPDPVSYSDNVDVLRQVFLALKALILRENENDCSLRRVLYTVDQEHVFLDLGRLHHYLRREIDLSRIALFDLFHIRANDKASPVLGFTKTDEFRENCVACSKTALRDLYGLNFSLWE